MTVEHPKALGGSKYLSNGLLSKRRKMIWVNSLFTILSPSFFPFRLLNSEPRIPDSEFQIPNSKSRVPNPES
jgi:hypothetical protein